ncbi:hypothetical protein Q7P35_005235 [Cladosporium inversicolor]
MGQGASQPLRSGDHQPDVPAAGGSSTQRRRQSSFGNLLRGQEQQPADNEDGSGLLSARSRRRLPMRSNSTNRLSRLLHSSTLPPSTSDAGPSRPSALQRSRTTLSNIFRRDDSPLAATRQSHSRSVLNNPAAYTRDPSTNDDTPEYHRSRSQSLDHNSMLEQDLLDSEQDHDQPPRSAGSHRLPNIRFNSLRPDRSFRHITSGFRRRRSPPPSSLRRSVGPEDQATMLSRLLSVAAAATAATLMGDDHQALSEARGLTGGTGIGEVGGNGEDGSFDGFLRALQNGRIASALRQGGDGQENGEGGQSGPLNFFRMFRFGTPGANGTSENPQTDSQADGSGDSNNGDNRMVPIIIVGIRSISPNSASGAGGGVDELPPFIDALGHFPSPLPAHALGAHGQDSIDSILRPPQNGTSFRHRRRASMGGLGMGRSRINDRYDDQRDHRSPDRRRERPWSVASASSNTEPRPPPATPASPSPELSRISSRNSTPSHSRPASFVANSIRDFASDSRRNSALQRVAASPLASHTEETGSLHSTRSSDNLLSQPRESDHFRGHRRSDTAPNIHYPRFASGHPRRNGVVEPDNIPSLSRSSSGNATESANPEDRSSGDSRSWIIYVLGGSYPENHPILTTPSLFTENPTYEDMMLLSTLLGPAKAPVATEDDVQNAGGIYELVVAEPVEDSGTTTIDTASSDRLMAIVTAETKGEDDPDRVYLEAGHRCLVCLCDFEIKETARRLAKCGHLFHKECIDHWLTQGRNSCPLCRGQGVNEKDKAASSEDEGLEEHVPQAAPEVAAA